MEIIIKYIIAGIISLVICGVIVIKEPDDDILCKDELDSDGEDDEN